MTLPNASNPAPAGVPANGESREETLPPEIAPDRRHGAPGTPAEEQAAQETSRAVIDAAVAESAREAAAGADEAGASWLAVWLEAPAWTIDEAATILAGIVPGQGDTCLPGLAPRGTIHGEGGEPPAVTARDRIFRPEAFRQREAGPCPVRVLWRGHMADAIRRNRGLLLGQMGCRPEAAFPPPTILQAATETRIVPPWIDTARADQTLAALLLPPPAPAADPAQRPVAAVGDERKDTGAKAYRSLATKDRLWPCKLLFIANATGGVECPDFQEIAKQLEGFRGLEPPSAADVERLYNTHVRPGRVNEVIDRFLRANRGRIEGKDWPGPKGIPPGLPDPGISRNPINRTDG